RRSAGDSRDLRLPRAAWPRLVRGGAAAARGVAPPLRRRARARPAVARRGFRRRARGLRLLRPVPLALGLPLCARGFDLRATGLGGPRCRSRAARRAYPALGVARLPAARRRNWRQRERG